GALPIQARRRGGDRHGVRGGGGEAGRPPGGRRRGHAPGAAHVGGAAGVVPACLLARAARGGAPGQEVPRRPGADGDPGPRVEPHHPQQPAGVAADRGLRGGGDMSEHGRRVLVLNGPNLGRLGKREPAVYGTATYADLVSLCKSAGQELGLDAEVRQTEYEGELITWVHEACDERL